MPLRLELKELRSLLLIQDRHQLLILRFAELAHLRAVGLDDRLQRLDLRRVVRIARRAEIALRRARLFEKCPVVLMKGMMELLPLRLLGIGQIEFFRETTG